jgi:hypothetical protein
MVGAEGTVGRASERACGAAAEERPLARSYTLSRRRAVPLLYRSAKAMHPVSRWRGVRVAIRHGLLSSKKRRTVML